MAIKSGSCHEILQIVAEDIAEQTETECFVHDENRVELAFYDRSRKDDQRISLCFFTIDGNEGTFSVQMYNNRGQWAEPYTVDLMEPESIEKLLLPTITLGKTMSRGFGGFLGPKP